MAKNSEVYKTAQERALAFRQFCDEGYMKQDCINCPLVKGSSCDYSCTFAWLDLEAEEEKPLPCPFCGGETVWDRFNDIDVVRCISCQYHSSGVLFHESAIAAHNRVARKCMEMKE